MAITVTTMKPMLNTNLQFDQARRITIPESLKLAVGSFTIVCMSFVVGLVAGKLLLSPLASLAFIKSAILFLGAFYGVSGAGAIIYCLQQKKSFKVTAIVASMVYAIIGLLSYGLVQ